MEVEAHEPEGNRPDQVDESPTPPQGYAGVTLHGGEPPPTTPPPSGLQAVTWPGFKADKSGSEVFCRSPGR